MDHYSDLSPRAMSRRFCYVLGTVAAVSGTAFLVYGFRGEMGLSHSKTIALGVPLIVGGILLVGINFLSRYFPIKAPRHARTTAEHHHQQGPQDALPQDPPTYPSGGPADAAAISSQQGTEHVESHEMTNVTPRNGQLSGSITLPDPSPLSLSAVAVSHHQSSPRVRSPLGLHAPMSRSPPDSQAHGISGQIESDANTIQDIKETTCEAAKPEPFESVMTRHVRFSEPLVGSKSTAKAVTASRTVESAPLAGSKNDLPIKSQQIQNYRIENGDITDLETGRRVDSYEFMNRHETSSNDDPEPTKPEKESGVARAMRQSYEFANGVVLDIRSLESAILRSGGSLKAGGEDEFSKSKDFLKAWKSTGSLKALLKNTSRGRSIADVEFV